MNGSLLLCGGFYFKNNIFQEAIFQFRFSSPSPFNFPMSGEPPAGFFIFSFSVLRFLFPGSP